MLLIQPLTWIAKLERKIVFKFIAWQEGKENQPSSYPYSILQHWKWNSDITHLDIMFYSVEKIFPVPIGAHVIQPWFNVIFNVTLKYFRPQKNVISRFHCIEVGKPEIFFKLWWDCSLRKVPFSNKKRSYIRVYIAGTTLRRGAGQEWYKECARLLSSNFDDRISKRQVWFVRAFTRHEYGSVGYKLTLHAVFARGDQKLEERGSRSGCCSWTRGNKATLMRGDH
jgi:hypothetical protein